MRHPETDRIARAVVPITVLAALSFLARPSAAQSAVWQPLGATSGNIYYNGGNVGIGTTSPAEKLQVGDGTGATGIAINGANSGANGAYIWGRAAGANEWLVSSLRGWVGGGVTGLGAGTTGPTPLAFFTNASERLRIDGAGNVGIGTTSPGSYKLAVEGIIGARDVTVTNLPWSDYVFQPGYRLRPLREVDAFIQRHHHLPDIPSEAEVKQDGVSLGQMQAKLLAKVEELTLHLIQQEKENTELRERLAELEKRIPAGSVAPAR